MLTGYLDPLGQGWCLHSSGASRAYSGSVVVIDRMLFPVAPLELEERQRLALIGLRALADESGLVSPRARDQVYEASHLSRMRFRAALPLLIAKGLVSRVAPEAYGRPERYQLSGEARTAPIGLAGCGEVGLAFDQPMGQPDFNPTSNPALPSSLPLSLKEIAKQRGRKEGSADDRVTPIVNPIQPDRPGVHVSLPSSMDPREAIALLEGLLAGYRAMLAQEAKAESPKAAVSDRGQEKTAKSAARKPRPPLSTKDRNGYTGHDACAVVCIKDRKHGHYGPRYNVEDREWFGCCSTCGHTYDLATQEAIRVNAKRDEKPRPKAREGSTGSVADDLQRIFGATPARVST